MRPDVSSRLIEDTHDEGRVYPARADTVRKRNPHAPAFLAAPTGAMPAIMRRGRPEGSGKGTVGPWPSGKDGDAMETREQDR